MSFDNETLGCHFTLPDPFTVGHVDAWENGRLEALAAGAKTQLSVKWVAACAIIADWKCEILPNHLVAWAGIADDQLKVISWVGREVERHIRKLTTAPKN